ncbi:FGGY-family carbohydrate kinase [Phycicoccus flavus]|uniref:FGGY-family carbohydrate kinase n=1 Tax=Phycicoccus flavus TaxID=2502783 RepID=UPI000FEB8558|nr:FGGY family carbohydrate kinase [Phycicoccus flavus]NHA69112.1 hypothetical protein [Phycicoccus flavus]
MSLLVDLGYDLGTTVTKVTAVAEDSTRLLDRSLPTVWQEREGHTQRRPESLLADVEDLLAQVAADLPAGSRIRSVGFTAMAEAGVLVDREGAACSPVIAWFDPRGADEAAALPADLAHDFPARTGLPVSHVASFFKLLWLREQGLDLAGLTWLGVPEYVVHRLGGRRVAELSLLGRTGLWDVHTGAPYTAALDHLGVAPDLLPEAVAAGTPAGTVRADHPVAAARGAVLTVAGHDHAVAAAATGCGSPGSALDSFGTAEAYVAAAAHVPDPDVVRDLAVAGISVYPHVVRDAVGLIGGTRTGLVLSRVQRVLGATQDPARDALDEATLRLAPGETADVRVTGYGMADREVAIHTGSEAHTPAHVWRAALDGGTARARELLGLLGDAGVPVDRLVVAGGWTRMRSVVAARRDLAPVVEVSDLDQPGTLGAARFGAWAATRDGDPGPDPRPPADWFPGARPADPIPIPQEATP